MRLCIILLFIFSGAHSIGAETKSKLVDVDKTSKLSDYFEKINSKVSDSGEDKALLSVEKSASNESVDSKNERVAEENILLKAAATKKDKAAGLSPMNKMVMAIVAFLFMAGAFLTSVKKMNKKKGHVEIAKNIKILTQKSIGPKKNLMLIRVAGETILLGVTDQNINHIKTLSLMEDELPSYTEPKFSNQLEEQIKKTKEQPSLVEHVAEEVDGYSVSRLDDVKQAVSRYSV